VGTATLTQQSGVTLQLTLSGFRSAKAGEHGIHIHGVGNCSPTFAAAGGHFNPGSHKHGFLNKEGHHAGDLPNLTVDSRGNARYQGTTDLVSPDVGATSLFDQDGCAIVIHAGPDDSHTDPAGLSGDRIACGVITRHL
jgi:Cu-Zn family superoxide dismutase